MFFIILYNKTIPLSVISGIVIIKSKMAMAHHLGTAHQKAVYHRHH